MKKRNMYLFVGLAWLACCLYQLKNNNMFMVVASGIVSFLFFALFVYKMDKDNDSDDVK